MLTFFTRLFASGNARAAAMPATRAGLLSRDPRLVGAGTEPDRLLRLHVLKLRAELRMAKAMRARDGAELRRHLARAKRFAAAIQGIARELQLQSPEQQQAQGPCDCLECRQNRAVKAALEAALNSAVAAGKSVVEIGVVLGQGGPGQGGSVQIVSASQTPAAVEASPGMAAAAQGLDELVARLKAAAANN